ncbi:MAG: transposase [Deltaproteobacteria bacterium]|nr:transposase [Deltaproteobacteria bacterium]
MPRSSRIDAPGALHHIIARGIGQRKIFDDDTDREVFLERLSIILKETDTSCFAWALMPNHFHLLLRTGRVSISTVMRRLLTGYAMSYNRRHGRSGHLFQNRYKSILCQEEPYFLELVRYIHLNPLRAKLVSNLNQLDRYAYSGHGVLAGKRSNDWQNAEDVLLRFAQHLGSAREKYREFIQSGTEMGKHPELTGGGLIRSMGGWSAVKVLRKAETYMKGDERILGDPNFVDTVLKQSQEAYERRHRLKTKGLDFEKIARRVAHLLDMPFNEVWSKGKYRRIVAARSLLCYWAVRELGMSVSELSRRFEVSATAISNSVLRGEALARKNNYVLEENEV